MPPAIEMAAACERQLNQLIDSADDDAQRRSVYVSFFHRSFLDF
jgi:hypothetical protein